MSENKPHLDLSIGGLNVHRHKCEPQNNEKRTYGCCLYLLSEFRKDNFHPDPADAPPSDSCAAAMKAGVCTAMKMRAEEEAAGYALYYTPLEGSLAHPRAQNRTFNYGLGSGSDNYQRGYEKAGRPSPVTPAKSATVKTKPMPKPIAKQDDGPLDMDMSKMINDMIDEGKKDE